MGPLVPSAADREGITMFPTTLARVSPTRRDQARTDRIERAEKKVFEIRKRIRHESLTPDLLIELSDAMDESVRAGAVRARLE